MPTTTAGIDRNTPLGATLTPSGVAFRFWAPHALQVFVLTDDALRAAEQPDFVPSPGDAMSPLGDGSWGAFVTDLDDGAAYRFWVIGSDDVGLNWDPRARELSTAPSDADRDCLVHDPSAYPWHDTAFRPPAFHQLILYQLHIGAFYAVDEQGYDKRYRVGRFLDLLDRVDHLRELGINGVQLLPIQRCSEAGDGDNRVGLFSPDTDYQIADDGELERYLWKANAWFARAGQPPLTLEQLRSGPNQLRCVIDIFHLNGITVLFDLEFNCKDPDVNEHSAGGEAFAYSNLAVRHLLIDNVVQFLEDYRIDGVRYDDVSVIARKGGAAFCRDLTSTARFTRPDAIQIAEYWADDRAMAVKPAPTGLGFDAAWGDRLRDGIRAAIMQAAAGRDAPVDIAALADAFDTPRGFGEAWRIINCVENHDMVFDGHWPRVPRLADPANPRSWYARSRSRLATGLLFAARGIPQLFMGQEILEDKHWSDDVRSRTDLLIWWNGLQVDPTMRDHVIFCRDLIRLRRTLPALSSEALHVSTRSSLDRVIAIHRWIEGSGHDVLFVASLQEESLSGYRIGFPAAGVWRELFNSDLYEEFPNPDVVGNAGSVTAHDIEWDGLPASAEIRLPPNGFMMFGR